MPIEQKPFTRYHEEKKADSFTVRLNEQERAELERCKGILEQKKDSTALKQMAIIGAFVIHSTPTGRVLEFLFINKRRNKDRGIVDFD